MEKKKLLLGNVQGKLTSGNLLGRMPLEFLLQVFYLESHFGTVTSNNISGGLKYRFCPQVHY